MHRHIEPSESALGDRVAIRLDHNTYGAIKRRIKRGRSVEQFFMGLYRRVTTTRGIVLLVHTLAIPDRNDLAEQTSVAVAPTEEFQAMVYGLAKDTRMGIIDIHTHTHKGVPSFSSVDETESSKNGRYIDEHFAPEQSLAMVVFGSDTTGHDAVLFDRSVDGFRQIDEIQVVGTKGAVLRTGRHYEDDVRDEEHDRHRLVHWWNQSGLQRQNIVVVGAGGNGAHVLQMLASMGAGREGFLAAIDHDLVEITNLPRIPYATREDIGKAKALVAGEMVQMRSPATEFIGLECKVEDQSAQRLLADATVIFGCGDNDGVRKVINEVAVRNKAVLIDCGCGIEDAVDGQMSAGGQVQLVIPGHNACLLCGQGFDPAEAALDLLDDNEQAIRARHGYVRGTDTPPAPSIGILNATIAAMAVQQLIALLHGGPVARHDLVTYDFVSGLAKNYSLSRDARCPCCGNKSVFGLGGTFAADKKERVSIPAPDAAVASGDPDGRTQGDFEEESSGQATNSSETHVESDDTQEA